MSPVCFVTHVPGLHRDRDLARTELRTQARTPLNLGDLGAPGDSERRGTCGAVSDPGDFDDAGHFGKGAHHVLELAQVGAIEGENVAGAAVVTGAAVGFADVDALSAEGLTHHRQDAWLIGGGDAELYRAVDLGLGVPADLDAALGIGVERLHALAAMDRDAAAAGDEADD